MELKRTVELPGNIISSINFLGRGNAADRYGLEV